MVLFSWDLLKKVSDEVKGRFNLKDCETHQHLMDVLHIDVHAVVGKVLPIFCVVIVIIIIVVYSCSFLLDLVDILYHSLGMW